MKTDARVLDRMRHYHFGRAVVENRTAKCRGCERIYPRHAAHDDGLCSTWCRELHGKGAA